MPDELKQNTDKDRRPSRVDRIALTSGTLGVLATGIAEVIGPNPGLGLAQIGLLTWSAFLIGLALTRPSWNVPALMLLMSVPVGLALSEGVLQVFYPAQFRAFYQLDPEVIFDPIPGARKSFVPRRANGGKTIRIAINSAGYRGPELDDDTDALRVAVYGDSFVEAEFSELEQTFSVLLAAELATDLGRPVEAVNAGVNGYGPDQVALRVARELPELKPDLVVVSVFAGNDHGDLIRNKLFYLSEEGILTRNAPDLVDGLKRRYERRANRRLVVGVIAGQILGRLAARIRVLPVDGAPLVPVVDFAERLEAARGDFEDYQNNPQVVHQVAGDPYDADMALFPDGELAVYKRALMQGVLGELARSTARAGVGLVVVVVPSPMDALDGYDLGEVPPDEFPDYERGGVTRAVTHVAAANDIRSVNLFEPFRSRGASMYFHGGDNHWTDEGQSVAARIVADSIASWGLLPGG